ncbi:hypothetical protein TWF569_005620 [Orbilia oligospora]|nr:hypothetical protein TWF569_005620 [Orbilia oligospora]
MQCALDKLIHDKITSTVDVCTVSYAWRRAALATLKPIVAGVLKYNSSTNLYLKSKYLIPKVLQFRAVVESI